MSIHFLKIHPQLIKGIKFFLHLVKNINPDDEINFTTTENIIKYLYE